MSIHTSWSPTRFTHVITNYNVLYAIITIILFKYNMFSIIFFFRLNMEVQRPWLPRYFRINSIHELKSNVYILRNLYVATMLTTILFLPSHEDVSFKYSFASKKGAQNFVDCYTAYNFHRSRYTDDILQLTYLGDSVYYLFLVLCSTYSLHTFENIIA